jgi:peptide/nickel transport system substrate-binding protein
VASACTVDDPARPTVYTFHLRDDVVWSDGTPLRAGDFVFGWRRALDGKESKYFSDIAGVRDYLAGRRDAPLGFRALDDRTFQVRLSGPRTYFTGYLAGVYAFYPAPAHVLRGLTEDQIRAYYRRTANGHPLALGPYRVRDWNRLDESVDLALNPHYPPLSGRVPRIILFPSDLATLLYDQGRVDFNFLDDGPSTFSHPADRRQAALWSTFWMGLSTRILPPDVRRAIALALDKRALGANVLPRFRVAAQLLPEGFPGRLPDGDPRLRTLPGFDPPAARRLVERAGWTGRELTLVYHENGTFLPEAALAEGVRLQLAAVGLRVKLLGTRSMAEEMLTQDRQARHALHFRRTGADFPHPQEFLLPFTYAGDPAQDNGSYTGFEQGGTGTAYRRYEREARATAEVPGLADMAAHAWEAQKILLADEVVVVPLFYPDRYFRTRPWLRELTLDPFNFIDFTRLTCSLPGRP